MYEFHPDLIAFRPAEQQYKAIVEISKLPEARLIIARHDQTIVDMLHTCILIHLNDGQKEKWKT